MINIFCTYELKTVANKTKKLPSKNNTLSPIKAETSRLQGKNIGVMLDCLPSITCLDIDDAHDKSGKIKDSVVYILNVCEKAGAVIERSQSGKGYHAFLSGDKPLNVKTRVKLKDGTILECYDSNSSQFIALSFDLITHPFKNIPQFYDLIAKINTGDCVQHITSEYLLRKNSRDKTDPSDFKQHDLTDSEVLKIAANSKHGAQFKRLHNDGDIDGFPSASEADYALMLQYAYFCACNAAQMKRLALNSALVRQKWGEYSYLDQTIQHAIEKTKTVYDPAFSANKKSNNVVKLNSSVSFTSNTEIISTIKNCSYNFLEVLPPAIAEFLSKSRPLPILQQQAAEYAEKIANTRNYKTEKENYSDIYSHASYMYEETVQNLYGFLQLDINTTAVNKRYLEANDALLGAGDTLLVRSHMNTGKTFAVMRENIHKLLKAKPHAKILALTGRQVLAEDIARKTGLNFYIDVKQLETAQEKKQASYQLSMCINSIGMVDLSIDYDLIIIDESELTLSHILGATIADSDRKRTVQSLYTLLNQADNVICLDAFISNVTHEAMQQSGRKNIRLLNNTYNPWSSVKVDWYADKTRLLDKASALVDKNESVFIFCNTKEGAKTRAKYYTNKYPSKKILCIHADNIKEQEQQDCIQDSNLLKNYDIVIASPTIEAGFSIELEEFKNVVGFFVHTKEGTGAALSSLQQLGRSRCAQNWHIWCDVKHYDYTVGYGELLTEYVTSNNFLSKHVQGDRLSAEFNIDSLARLNASVKSWENTQRSALALTLYTFISDYMGMSVEFMTKKGKKETRSDVKEAASEVLQQDIDELVNAESIDESTAKELYGKKGTTGVTRSQDLSLKKHELISMLPPSLAADYEQFGEIYLKNYMKKVRRIEQLTCDKNVALKYAALKVDGGIRVKEEKNSEIEPLPVTEYAKKNTLLYRTFMGHALKAAGYDISRLSSHGLEVDQLKKISFTIHQIMGSDFHKFLVKNWQAINMLGVCTHINSVDKLHKHSVVSKLFTSIFNSLYIPLNCKRQRGTGNSKFLYKTNNLPVPPQTPETQHSDLHGGTKTDSEAVESGQRVRVYWVDLDRFKADKKSEQLYTILEERFTAGMNWMSEYCADKELHTHAAKVDDLTQEQQEAIMLVCQELDYDDAKKECESIFKGFTLDYQYYARACNSYMFDYEETEPTAPILKLSNAT